MPDVNQIPVRKEVPPPPCSTCTITGKPWVCNAQGQYGCEYRNCRR